MIVTVKPLDSTVDTEARFEVTLSNLKPGKQQAASRLLTDFGRALQDGKLDLFEIGGLVADVSAVNK